MKKTLLPLLILALLLAIIPSYAQQMPEGYDLSAQNEKLSLYLNQEDGSLILENRENGFLWLSNPQGNDNRAKGVHRQTLMSQIGLTYSNERGTSLALTSAGDAARSGGLHFESIENGFKATYDFAKPLIRLNVYYTLEKDHLKVSLPVEEIVCYEDEEGNANLNTVTAVDLLPVMGAGSVEDQGFLLVPDGSGAVIHFNNGVTSMAEYAAPIYGKDPGLEGQVGVSAQLAMQARTQEQTARLPVFGTYHEKDGGNALLGIIAQNEAKATVLARVSNLTSYNYAWSRFRVRGSGSMMMNSKEFGSSVIGVSEREGLTVGNYEVRYYPLKGEQATTAGMAGVYRDYLIKEKGLNAKVTQGDYPLYLELYGQIKKPAQVLGIPYTKTVNLTTLEDVSAITQALDLPQITVRYAEWMKNTSFEQIPQKADLSPSLGKNADLLSLDEELAADGGGLYPAADLVNVYKAGRGFWAIRDAVLSPVNSPQLQFQTSYSSRAVNPAIAPWYLLSPAKYDQFFNRFYDSYNKLNLPGLALDSLGEMLMSDNRSSLGVGRSQAVDLTQQTLSKADKDLMLTGGNAYAAVQAAHLLSTPSGSSGYTLADEEIPFYQMVFHGLIPYGIGQNNHAADPDAFLLRCLEYGASPQYAFVGRNREELADSRLAYLYSPDYEAWTQEVREAYQALQAVLQPLAHLTITHHQKLPGGAITVYGDQTAVYVNYSDMDLVQDGLTIPAKSYAVKEVSHGAD